MADRLPGRMPGNNGARHVPGNNGAWHVPGKMPDGILSLKAKETAYLLSIKRVGRSHE